MGGSTTQVSSSTGDGVASRAGLVFTWARRPPKGSAAALRRIAGQALRGLGVDEGEIGVLICGDEAIRSLNRTFRGKDVATDVLAFPAGDRPPDGPTYLGDIAISLDMARRQAAAAGVNELTELALLLVHGILHLLGHDHERDRGEMAALEEQLRAELGL